MWKFVEHPYPRCAKLLPECEARHRNCLRGGSTGNGIHERWHCLFPGIHRWQASLDRFVGRTLFHANLLQCLQDGCIGSYRFEVAMSLVLLFVNPLEENEAALDIDSE